MGIASSRTALFILLLTSPLEVVHGQNDFDTFVYDQNDTIAVLGQNDTLFLDDGMATIGPTEGDDMDMMGADEGLVDVEDQATIFPTEANYDEPIETVRPGPTFPPEEEEAMVPTHTCGTGSPANESICTEYKATMINNEHCECYYFCAGGGLAQCLHYDEVKAFGCSGDAEIVACFEAIEEETETSAAEPAVDSVNSLFYTVSVALGALISAL